MGVSRQLVLLIWLAFLLGQILVVLPVVAAPVQMETIASGGPFQTHRRSIQHFAGKFKLSRSDSKKPMQLVLHNGFGDSPCFKWLRVFLCGDIAVRSLGSYEEPQGDLIFDENYVQKHVITLDLTDLVQEGVNTIYIEGKGKRGAVISWSVLASTSPQLSMINPGETHQGARLTLVGKGFSHDENENVVYIGDKRLDVLNSSRTRLTLKVPENIDAGHNKLKVVTNGIPSEVTSIKVKATPKVRELRKIASNKRGVIIIGENLDGNPKKTEVYFGNYRAKILKETANAILVLLPEDMLASGEANLKVSVSVNGITASGTLFYN